MALQVANRFPGLRDGQNAFGRCCTHAGRLQAALDDFERAEQLGYGKAAERRRALQEVLGSEQRKLHDKGQRIPKAKLGAVSDPDSVQPPQGLDGSDARFSGAVVLPGAGGGDGRARRKSERKVARPTTGGSGGGARARSTPRGGRLQ